MEKINEPDSNIKTDVYGLANNTHPDSLAIARYLLNYPENYQVVNPLSPHAAPAFTFVALCSIRLLLVMQLYSHHHAFYTSYDTNVYFQIRTTLLFRYFDRLVTIFVLYYRMSSDFISCQIKITMDSFGKEIRECREVNELPKEIWQRW